MESRTAFEGRMYELEKKAQHAHEMFMLWSGVELGFLLAGTIFGILILASMAF